MAEAPQHLALALVVVEEPQPLALVGVEVLRLLLLEVLPLQQWSAQSQNDEKRRRIIGWPKH